MTGRLFKRIKELLFPRSLSCLYCQKELNDEERRYSLCKECFSSIKRLSGNPERIILNDKSAFDLISLYAYPGLPQWLVLNVKDFGKPFLSIYLARFLADGIAEYGITADYITYVPRAENVKRKQGYDHMELIARRTAKYVGIPILNCFNKAKSVDSTAVELSQREEIVNKAFSLRDGLSLTGKRILVLDDVVTTGSTARKCCSLLSSLSPASITFLTFTKGKSFHN